MKKSIKDMQKTVEEINIVLKTIILGIFLSLFE